MPDYEVPEPILNSPYAEPGEHWNVEEGASPETRPGRRPAGYFYRDPKAPPSDSEHDARGTWEELKLVNLVRERVKQWRSQGYPGVTRNRRQGHRRPRQRADGGQGFEGSGWVSAQSSEGSDSEFVFAPCSFVILSERCASRRIPDRQ